MLLADIAVARPLASPLTYLVPDAMGSRLQPGHRVIVPLGGGACEGIVLGLREDSAPTGLRLRPIREALGDLPALSPDLLDLGRWMSAYYVCALGEALSAMVHPYVNTRRTIVWRLAHPPDAGKRLGPRQKAVLDWLQAAGGSASAPAVREALGEAAVALRKLEERGLVLREEISREPGDESSPPSQPFPRLTAEQQPPFDAILQDLTEGRPQAHLLHGVTGSGKTEIYLALVRQALAAGGGAIFLVPEISLTVPMIALFRARFGGTLALFHSALTPSQRHREWTRVRLGEARVVVGARSAVFAPVQGLRMIVIDEEAETSYKQQERPCYHARDVAVQRGRIAGFPVVLGSATPCLESYRSAREGIFCYHVLTRRFNDQPLPAVELVDMALEFSERRNRSIFSHELKRRMEEVLAAGRQALLFVNRRGHSTYVFCRACGFVLECHQCSVSLTFHELDGSCRCHQCDFTRPSPQACPGCGSAAIRFLVLGTQKVEEELKLNFPGVTFSRMDSDTTASRGSHERILEDFALGRSRVLIGTQMVAKGFNFPALDLVGVVNADVALRVPDFRAAERTFQLVTQVAGRAGRAERPGRVLVQTYTPRHHALRHARLHAYEAFAAEEMPTRQQLFYPPYSSLILIGSEADSEEAARSALGELREKLLLAVAGGGRAETLGPARAPLARVRGRHRYQLLLKLETDSSASRRARELLAAWQGPSGVDLRIDVDPIRMT